MADRKIADAIVFDLALPSVVLEGGATIERHVARGWCWGPSDTTDAIQKRTLAIADSEYHSKAWLAQKRSKKELDELRVKFLEEKDIAQTPACSDDIPTVLLVHALTGDMRAGGPGGWWENLIGPDRAIDPAKYRILCFNLLGSCYGASGPADEGFPHRTQDSRFLPATRALKGDFTLPEAHMPATVTTWDQARSILLALDALGIGKVHLATGGSLGAMVVMCLAALAPDRFSRIAPIGAADKATSWIIGWNHVQRRAICLDPGFPDDPYRGMELARQIGMLTYRAEEGTELRQGRAMASSDPAWSSREHYKIHTYLEHQGQKLIGRFHAGAYLALSGAMDHHDLARQPHWFKDGKNKEQIGDWGLARIKAKALCVGINSDQLFFPETIRAFAEKLKKRGSIVEYRLLETPFGHDGFLIEMGKMDNILRQALEL
jgi:homoserine O-acetyltransferase/O-succinyltransferase